MEAIKKIALQNKNYELARKDIALFTYILLCLRGCFGWLGIDTLFLTLLLNIFIVFSIDYTKVSKSFLIIPLFCLLILINKQILGVIDLVAMTLILRKENIRYLANTYFIILVIFIPIWLFLLYNGYITSERWFDPNKGGEFFDYGFASPNGLGIFGFNIIAILFLLKKRKSLFLIIPVLIINQIFFTISSCRTAWIGGLVLALCILVQYYNGFKNWMKYVLAILPPLLTFGLIYISRNIANFIAEDILFSGRLSIYNSVLNQMGVFNYILGIKLPDGPMDGSYMMLFFIGGLILSVFYWFLNFKMMIFSFDKIKPFLPFILSVMACGVMETTFSSCGGLSLLFWFLLINKS